MSLFYEFKRRNVFRVAVAYVVVAWLVIQIAETIFPLFGFDDNPARITVIVLAIGLVPVLVFAWAFELTPEGLKKESEVDRTQSISPQTGKKLDRIIMVMLALALGYFAFDKFVLDPQRDRAFREQNVAEIKSAHQQGRREALVESYGDKSIAVLPFVNMSDDPGNEYFSDGVSEELLNLLAKIPNLRVISRSSAFSYKGKNIKLAQVAEELNVAHILEGSVRKAGNQVRITAQLIEARSDTHLWSETYDRTLDDIFAVQDEIGAAVVKQLKITLMGEAPQVKEPDPEAYALRLQARHLARLFTAEGWEQSNALYQQALVIEPDYAEAWIGLSSNYSNQTARQLLPLDEGIVLAREAAEKALAIDPDHAQSHASLGWIAMVFDDDLAQSARHFERALQLDSTNIGVISNATTLLFILGRLDEAIALDEYGVARDPVDATGHYNLGSSYQAAGRWDEAIASFQTAQRLSPGYLGVHDAIGTALLFKGETEAALAEFALEEEEGYRIKGTALALHALGRHEEYEAALTELIEYWGEQLPSEIAHVYAMAGDPDAAFEWLEKEMELTESINPYDDGPMFYTALHGDPRWLPLLERSGTSPAQLDAIEFEVTLP